MDIDRLRDDLAGLTGTWHLDPISRGIYATDASHYQQMPTVVVLPADQADCLTALAIAQRHGLPVTARGGGTSLSGQTFGHGMIIDQSMAMDQVLAIDLDDRSARVQPGVIRDRLNNQLAPHGLHFAPDPATGNRATIGGMIGNNTSGTRSIVHGKTIDHLIACTVALADGTILELDGFDAADWPDRCARPGVEGALYRGVHDLVSQHADAIRARFPRVMRRVSGYNLDEFVADAGYRGPIGPRATAGRRPLNLGNLVVGSEGTLALLLEATIRLTPVPAATGLCVVHFDDPISALRAVPAINAHDPSAVELLDRIVLDEARINPATRTMADFIEGEPGAVLLVEICAADDTSVRTRLDRLVRALAAASIGTSHPIRTDAAGQARVWEVRKLGLGLISNVPGPVKGQAFVEDACVPVEHCADYIADLAATCEAHKVRYSMYAHASVGVIHFRPMLDLHHRDQRQTMRTIARHAFERCLALGGSFAGEHGDGIVRGEFIPDAFGDDLYKAFKDLKRLWDPNNRMNPGKIIDTPAMTDASVLRYGDAYQPTVPDTRFRYRSQGSFQLAVEQCNGVGACRKTGSGTMCPSYMATRDERHSTRGRANALRLAMSGQLDDLPVRALASDELSEVLELCLSCKACTSECPNTVDMAKLKAEALQWRHDRTGIPLGARLVGALPELLPWQASFLGRLGAQALKIPGVRFLLECLTGLDRRRPLPQPATRSLHQELANHAPRTTGERVLVFADTYATWYEPTVGVRAVDLLEDAGFQVEVVHPGCCQRPRISQGLLDAAKAKGTRTMAALDQLGDGSAPIICLEPSCASALAHDLPDLIDDAELGRRVADRVIMIDRFLAEREIPLRSTVGDLTLHTHCHQRADSGCDHRDPRDASTERIDAGCCGMAGAFGYQHHDLSTQVAGDRWLPALQQATADGRTIVANGISCRHQAADLAGVQAKHWVEVVDVINDTTPAKT